MKLLLDENLPIKLKYRFIENGIDTFTAKDMEWIGKENGDLLKEMLKTNFTTLITIDNNIAFQNNFSDYRISVLILVAYDNTYETIMEFFDKILENAKQTFTGPRTVLHPNYKIN